jgi:hypothetical protein
LLRHVYISVLTDNTQVSCARQTRAVASSSLLSADHSTESRACHQP